MLAEGLLAVTHSKLFAFVSLVCVHLLSCTSSVQLDKVQ